MDHMTRMLYFTVTAGHFLCCIFSVFLYFFHVYVCISSDPQPMTSWPPVSFCSRSQSPVSWPITGQRGRVDFWQIKVQLFGVHVNAKGLFTSVQTNKQKTRWKFWLACTEQGRWGTCILYITCMLFGRERWTFITIFCTKHPIFSHVHKWGTEVHMHISSIHVSSIHTMFSLQFA